MGDIQDFNALEPAGLNIFVFYERSGKTYGIGGAVMEVGGAGVGAPEELL